MDRTTIALPVLVTLVVNAFVTYGLLFNAYHGYLDSPQFSKIDPGTIRLWSDVLLIVNLILIWGTSIWMIFLFWKRGRFVFYAPIVTAVTIIVLVFMMRATPDSVSEYTRQGYKYREEIWWLGGKVDKYRKWKSLKPVTDVNIGEKVVWELDSISVD
jgi:hypothetical protein